MFQLKKTSNKKVIANKPLTNLYEMNSSSDAAFEKQRLSWDCIIVFVVPEKNFIIKPSRYSKKFQKSTLIFTCEPRLATKVIC